MDQKPNKRRNPKDTVYRAHALAVFGAGLTDQNGDSRPAKQNSRYIPRSQRPASPPSSCHADVDMLDAGPVDLENDDEDDENAQASPYPHDVPNEQEQTLEENDTGCVPAPPAPDPQVDKAQDRADHRIGKVLFRVGSSFCAAVPFWKLPSSDIQHSDFPCAFLLFRFVFRTH